jgi:curved DNA-binding protein CbpA
MSDKDHYSVLGLTRKAHPDVVRAAYYALVKKYHPDATGNNPALLARFREIAEAWEALGQPDKREAYDRSFDGDTPNAPPLESAPPNAENTTLFLVGICGAVLLIGLIIGAYILDRHPIH